MSKRLTKKQVLAYKKKLKDYTKFLRDDFDWDWHYIIRLLRYKLERTRDCIKSNNIIADVDVVCKQIQEVIDLLLRLENDVYFEEAYAPIWKKYGHSRIVRGKESKNSVAVKVLYEKETPRNSKYIRKAVLKAAAKENDSRLADLKKVLDLIYKNLFFWWD